MDQQIVCPNCKSSIPLTEALAHKMREEFAQKARNQLIEDRKKLQQQFDAEKRKIEEEQKNLQKQHEDTMRKKVEEEMKLKLENTANEAEESRKQIKELQTQILELTKSLRESRNREDQIKIENEKKLLEEQEKIREMLQKTLEDQYKFKLLEKEKQLEDTKRALDEAKRKTEQVSQQLQGEVLELELENILRSEFPYDEIKAVGKGVRGGDIIHVIKTNTGQVCGTIVWESKRTQDWQKVWIEKVKQDQRSVKAEYAVIISKAIPGDIKNFAWRDGVGIGTFECVAGIAQILRNNLLEVNRIKMSQQGKSGKMEILYNYIYGTEFKQRVEAIMEAFTSLQNNMEREKRWFAKKWAEDEKSIRRVLDNTLGMSGDLESITGKELTDFESMDNVDLLTNGMEDEIASQDTLL